MLRGRCRVTEASDEKATLREERWTAVGCRRFATSRMRTFCTQAVVQQPATGLPRVSSTDADPVKAFYSDRFVLPLPPEHSFPMAKYRLLRERLEAEGILSRADIVEAPAADWDTLGLVHAPQYLHAVRTGTLPREAQRRIGFPWSREMVERSRRSVGATIASGAPRARRSIGDGGEPGRGHPPRVRRPRRGILCIQRCGGRDPPAARRSAWCGVLP